MGYYLVFVGMEYRHDVRMSRSLDEDVYDPSRVVTLKIPLAVPYMYDNADFVRVAGKFQHKGETYRLIKQRYQQDTLTVICMKDQYARQIKDAMADYVSTFADQQPDGDNPHKVPTFIKDYIPFHIVLKSKSAGWVAEIPSTVTAVDLTARYSSIIQHPPESSTLIIG
jgi:hypothetical protein